jgi:RNA polymerase sigma factor (sigma-70 family)
MIGAEMRILRLRPRSRIDEAAAAQGSMSDRTLVADAADDPCAFDALFTRYWDAVYRYCFSRLGSREDAEDAAIQILAKVHAGLGRFSDAHDSFRSWLFTIAHNEVANRRRHADRHSEVPLEYAEGISDPAPSPEEHAIAAGEIEETRRTLAQLTQRPRQVMELRLAGLTDREIASVLEIGHDAVRQAQSRGLAQLRIAMSAGYTGREVRGV